ncbi:MAG TPA: hypothetical protein VNH44_18295 [Micropepsaceae bacterium]|nr:hypothetical protein [Micropepsaceae bacterium]
MTLSPMSVADIAEILKEAAVARELAATFDDTDKIADLLRYATALEADAASELVAAYLPFRSD